ncbi:Tat pathway signal sequence domain protein [Streptomyces sp. NPDC050658]|uniref:Tat pathway signal sequence domain protein n=1 Tax=unclassified Streptomyces TaxID=2593676 RepID=UPI00342A1364
MAIGPVEPGDDTYDTHATYADGVTVRPVEPPRPRLTRRRRTALAAAVALAVGVTGLTLYLTRPRPPEPPPPLHPSQTVSVTYEGGMSRPEAGDRTFTFAVSIAQDSGPPVSVRRIAQPSAALSVTATPDTPFTVKTGTPRKARITMHIRECGKVPRNAGLPFLEVTLRNVRAKQTQSFILGSTYANDLSRALAAACPRTPVS